MICKENDDGSRIISEISKFGSEVLTCLELNYFLAPLIHAITREKIDDGTPVAQDIKIVVRSIPHQPGE